MKNNIQIFVLAALCVASGALFAADNVPAIIRSAAIVAEKEANKAAEETLAKHIAIVNGTFSKSPKGNEAQIQQVYTDPTVWGSFDDVCSVK